ncbi:MAG: hypothetical protein ACOC9P_00955 [bacterium]
MYQVFARRAKAAVADAARTTPGFLSLCVCLALGTTLSTSPAGAASYHVDPERGADDNAGTAAAPFRTINGAVGHLAPGDTLYLNDGVYLEHVLIENLVGKEDAPIVIRAREGANVEIYAGVPYFRQPGNDHWEHVPNGAPDEWRSTMELPAGGYHGQFLKNNIRLARYSDPNDFRASNELWARNLSEHDTRPGPESTGRDGRPTGKREGWIYYGPGLRYNAGTRRLHIRLSHTKIADYVERYYQGENDPRRYPKPRAIARQTEIDNYTGPTDPRKLALAIAPDGTSLTLRGSKHIEFRGLTIRNEVSLANNEHITFRDVVFYPTKSWGGFNGDRHVRFLHCAFDGGMPPWHFRAEYKGPYWYRTPEGEVVRNNRIRYTNRTLFSNYGTRDVEIAYSELRNAHDVYLAGVNTHFHHNLVEDIHDDALFVSYPDEIENMHVHHNVFRRVLMGMAYHGNRPGVSRFVYRNIFDMREPARSGRPSKAVEQGHWAWRSLFVAKAGEIGPLAAYQNTFLVRNAYTITRGLQHPNPDRPRQLFNNLFISLNPSTSLIRPIDPSFPAQVDGNLWWRHKDAGTNLFAGVETLDAYRSSEKFERSKQWYSPGWHAQDIHANPRFKRFRGDARPDDDLRLSADSAARGAGVPLPDDLVDPDRPKDGSAPDIGALPYGAEPLRVGRHQRFSFPDEQRITAARDDPPAASSRRAQGEAGEATDYYWTADGGSDTWSDPANWRGGEAPDERTAGRVMFEIGSAFTVRLDGPQALLGGVVSSTFRGRGHLDLAGYELTLADDIRLGGPRHSTRFTNGTLALGTPDRAAALRVQENEAGEGSVRVAEGTTLDAVNLRLLSVADGSGNRGPTATLDLTKANLADNALGAETILLGRYSGSSSRGGDGTLRLPASARQLRTNRLLIGHNGRNGGSGSDPAHGRGTLDLGGGERLTLTVDRWLSLASGDHTDAVIDNAPAQFNLVLGSPDQPAGARLAHNRLTQGGAGDHAATAELTVPSGSVRAHLTELRVGHNPRQGGEARGVLDLSGAVLEAFHIHGTVASETYYRRGDMQAVPLYPDLASMLGAPVVVEGALLVGLGTNAEGSVRLPAGEASAGWAFIGDRAAGSHGVLELQGTQLTLRQGLTIGPGGEVVVNVTDDAGSITLTNKDAVLEIKRAAERSGTLRIVYKRGESAGPALRWRGTHMQMLQRLLEEELIQVEGAAVRVVEDDGWTELRPR